MVRDNDDLDENAVELAYKIVDDLLYFDDDEKGLRLYIPSAMEGEVFKLTHDEMDHPGYARTHERLTSNLYIFGLAIKLHEFIRHCPQCQVNQTPRHRPYGSLQPILTPARPVHILAVDQHESTSFTIQFLITHMYQRLSDRATRIAWLLQTFLYTSLQSFFAIV